MKTVIDTVDEIYQLVAVPIVKNMITGSVYPDKRPDGSELGDVVINSLPITGAQLQVAVVNINIHVPNLQLTINGQNDNSQPNRKRLKEIADVIIPLVKNAIINNMVTDVETVSRIEEKDLKEHYLNIRVKINSINL